MTLCQFVTSVDSTKELYSSIAGIISCKKKVINSGDKFNHLIKKSFFWSKGDISMDGFDMPRHFAPYKFSSYTDTMQFMSCIHLVHRLCFYIL